MNWLAHLYLSELSIDFQVGNILADPLKAKPWETSSEDLKKGMKTHLLIDSFSDKDEYFKKSKQRLKTSGILRGIVVDFTYDYLLSKNWDKFCNTNLQEFKEQFYKKSLNSNYPSNVNGILINIYQKRLLDFNSYTDLEKALKRVDMRISQRVAKRDSAISYLPLIEENIIQLEEDFLNFFPKLCKMVKSNVNTSKLSHFKL